MKSLLALRFPLLKRQILNHSRKAFVTSVVSFLVPLSLLAAKGPSVPTGVSATAVSCSQVNISWAASTSSRTIKNYTVYRNGSLLDTVAATATSYSDTSVAAGTSYSYTVSGTDNSGESAQSSPAVSVTTPACGPTTPGSARASAVSCSQINVSWSASTDSGATVTQYNVYRNGVSLATVTAPSTSFSDTTVVASTTYNYTVSARDSTGLTSAQSAVASATTSACPDTTPPTVPNNVVASAVNCTNVSVSWSASTDTGSGVHQYNVYRNGALITVIAAPATSFLDRTVAASTGYAYTVSATDVAGNTSAASAAASVNTPACGDITPPTVPTGVSASAASCNQVNVSWNASTDTGSGVKQYNIYRNNTLLVSVASSVTSYTDATVAASTSYSYTVSATDNAGNTSAQSTAAGVTTPACSSPSPSVPLKVGAVAVSCSQVNVSWNASTDPGSTIKQYNVYRQGTLIATVLAPNTSYSDTSVAASTSYSYTVSATDNAGVTSQMSGLAGATTPACSDTTPPTVPAGVSATASSCSQVNISWQASTDSGSGVKQYNVYRNGALRTTVSAPSTSFSDTSVAASTTYSYTVSATDNSGNTSAQSGSAGATTPACVVDTTPPTVPTNVVAAALSCTNVTLSWAASTDSGSGVQQYNIYRNGALINIIAAPSTSVSDTSVSPSTAYSYTISATDGSGNTSALSATAPVTTPACGGGGDTTPPTVPTGVTATAVSCANVSVSWTASTDSGSGVKQYNVYRNGALLTFVSAPTTSFSDTTVAASSSYNYTVSATDNAGNTSSQSTAGGVTTPACADTTPPTVPTGVTATATSCTSVSVSWTASTDTGSGVKQYNVYRNGGLLTVVSAPTTSVSDATVGASSSYSYTVSATDNAGNTSSQSTAAGVTTPACGDTTPPTVPTGVTATAASCTNVSVSWNASTDTGSGVKQYNVYRNGALIKTVSSTSTSDTTVAGSSSYSYTVSATDNAGNTSAQSTAAGVTTPSCADTTPPTVPTGVTATAVSCTNVSITWTASTDSGSGVKQYNVYRNGALLKTVTTASATDSTASGGTSYSYTVSATDNAGNTSAQSTAGAVTTPTCADTTPPTVPTGVSATAVSCTQVSISWNASTDTGSGVKQYNVYRNGALLTTVPAPTTSAADTTASASTTYSYTVSAADNAGNNSAQSTAAGVTTPTCSVGAPPSVSFLNPSQGSSLSGKVTVSALLTDNSALSSADFYYANGGQWTLISNSPASGTIFTNNVLFDTTTVGNGSTYLLCRAYNTAGSNSYTTVSVSINNTNSFGLSAGQLQWVKDISSSIQVLPAGIAIDSSNNTVVAGAFSMTANFGGGSVSSAGGLDCFIAKYSSSGQYLWARTFGGIGDERIYSVTVDGQNNIIVTGYFEDTVNFGGVTLTAPDPLNLGRYSIFVAKYSASGSLVWAMQFGGPGDEGKALAADASGNVYLAASYSGTCIFGGINVSSVSGCYNIGLVKFSSAGTTLWAKSYGTSTADVPNAMAVDASGNLFVTGSTSGASDFGGGAIGSSGAFFAKYSGSTGGYLWAKSPGGTAGNDVTTDPATGNVFFTGGFTGSINLGGGALTTSNNGGIFVVAYGSSGNWLWNNAYGGNGDSGMGISLANGYLAVTGNSGNSLNFGGGVLNSGYFVAEFSISGSTPPTYHWARSASANSCGIAFDSIGHLLTTGTFTGTVDFGGISATASAPYGDNFVAQYAQ